MEIVDFGIRDGEGKPATRLESGNSYTAFMRICFHADVKSYSYGIAIHNTAGLKVFGAETFWDASISLSGAKGDLVEARMDFTLWLVNGDYFMHFGVGEITETSETSVQDSLPGGLHFSIYYEPRQHTDTFVNLQHSFSASIISS
jgi:hypothetical protein